MPTPPQDFISRPPFNVQQPGAYSAVDASLLADPNAGPAVAIPAAVGVAAGGQPNTPIYFRSPGQLRQVLQSGPVYDVARFMFDGGAEQVCVVRVGNSITQAALTLAGASGNCVTLTARDWGAWANAILVSVAAGPIITIVYVSPLGVTYTEKWDLSAIGSLTNQKIADAINGNTFGYSQSNYVTATAGSGTLPLATISSSALTGGTDGTSPAAGDWTNGLTALESQPISIIVPAVGDATVHAQVQTHCVNMSAPAARHERTCLVGGILGESPSQAITRIQALPSARVQLVYPGNIDFNASGQQTSYDPFYLAGKIAGMHCSLDDPAESLVHARVPVVGVERNLSTIQGGDIDQLLAAGVTPVAPAPRSGYWIIDSLTGYTGADGTFRDFHKTRSTDFVAQYARNQLEGEYVGSKNLAGEADAIAASANNVMDDLLAFEVISAHLDSVVTQGPNVNSWNVSLPVMLVDTNKFMFITVALQPSAITSNTGSLTAADALA